MRVKEFFPDGTLIDDWFYNANPPCIETLGKCYLITDFGVKDDGKTYTKELQAIIDEAFLQGGGVVVVPKGRFLTGALFFKKGVHLCVQDGATLMGSDDISEYPVMETRIEGETCMYYPALINADNADGFTLMGGGVIDGNGWRAWKAFWQRRKWNPNCTNKDEQRPRLLYVSNSNDVTIAGVTLQNSHFWTTHIYRCKRVKYLHCRILADTKTVRAPSSDAIDIDVCEDVLIKNCYFEVNDDSVVLKGGKGPWADTDVNNGGNERILVEDCVYGACHGVLTCGSESIYNRNVLVRRACVEFAYNLLWLKMRPDTPQLYEYIVMEEITGQVNQVLRIFPWLQFFDLKGRESVPPSVAKNIVLRNMQLSCKEYLSVSKATEQYQLSDFTFQNLRLEVSGKVGDYEAFDGAIVENVEIINE